MPIPEAKPEGLCTNCIQPCVNNDGECMGPVTEEEQRAINGAIIYEYNAKKSAGTILSEVGTSHTLPPVLTSKR